MPAQAKEIDHDPCVQTDSQQPMLHQDFQVSVVQEEFFLMKVVDSARQLCLHVAYTPTKDGFLQKHFPSGPVHCYAEFHGALLFEAIRYRVVRVPECNRATNGQRCGYD